MKLHKTGKMVRIVSLVLIVAIMMSVCLVQAFAVRSASGSVGGYGFTVNISQPNAVTYRVHVVSDTTMIHSVTTYAYFDNTASGTTVYRPITSDYNGWDITHNHYAPTACEASGACTARVVSTYNGMSSSEVRVDL